MAISADVRATYMEAWPDALLDLSMPTAEIELSEDDLLAIGSSSPAFREHFALNRVLPVSPAVRSAIESMLEEFPAGVFPRLGTCSFKQASSSNRPLTTASAVVNEITSVNERVAAAIRNALRDGYRQSLYLREWRLIPRWSEFRVFIRSRKVCGISQYHHDRTFTEIDCRLTEIIELLVPAVREAISASTLSDFVADFYVRSEIKSAEFIEINPLYEKTDACLYSWETGGNFDGHLRYRGAAGRVVIADIRKILTRA